MSGLIASLLVGLGIDPSGVDKGIGDAETRIGKFTNGLNRSGAAMTKGLTLPIVALGGFALKSAMDVDEAYDTIQAGTGATGDRLAKLEGVFDRVARRTPAQLGDVATTVSDLNRRLDVTGPTLQKLSRQVLEASRLGDVPINIKNATSAFSVFGVEGRDTTTAMDDLFRISQATGVGINDLTAIMAKSGGVLTQLGFGFGESATLIGVLDKAGINSRAVMSSLSAGLVKLAKDGEAPADAFDRTVGKLQEFVDSGKDAKALKLAGEIFGSRGAGQFVAALKSGKVNLDDIAKSADRSGGSILGVAAKTKDFPEIWQEFKNRATLALAPIAADWLPKIADGLTKLGGYLRTANQWWSGLSDETQGYIVKALAVAAALGPTLMIFAKVITLIQTLAPLLKVLQLAWAALNIVFAMSPLGLIVIAIAALVAGLVIAYKKSETFRDIVNGAFGAVKDFVVAALDWIIAKAKSWGPYLLGALGGPVGILVVLIIKHWDTIKAKTAAAWDWVVSKVKAIPAMLVRAFMNFTLPGLIIKHWDTIKTKTSAAWDAVVGFVKSVPGRLLSFFLNWTLAGRIIKHWDEAKDGTIRVASAIVAWVAGLPGKIIGKLASLAGGLADTASNAFGRLRSAAENKVSALLTYVAGIPNRVKTRLGDLGTLLLEAGRSLIQGLIDGITDKAGDLMGKLQSITSKIPDWKGPADRDARLLTPAGVAIMEGLIRGISSKERDLADELGKVTDAIEKSIDKRIEKDKLAAAATRKVIIGIRDERAELLRNERAYDRIADRLEAARDRLHEIVSQARDYAASIRDMVVDSANITGFVDQQGIDDARQRVAALTQEVESYAASIRDAMVAFGTITDYVDKETGTVTATDIVAGLEEKVAAAWRYTKALQELATLGLSQDYIAQLTAAGVEGGLATAEALLAGGQAAIDRVNDLNDSLTDAGTELGESLAGALYGSGVDAAKALADGLAAQGAVSAASIVAGLRDKVFAAYKFQQALTQLAAMGLSQDYIDQLTAAGVEGGLATAQALVDGGQAAVDQVNFLNGALNVYGQQLGDDLADTMYGSGIKAAQALVDSLESRRAAIEKTGRRLARAFARALQDELDQIHVTVKVEQFSVDKAYAGASASVAKATPSAKASSAAEATDRTDEVVDALREVKDAVVSVKGAVDDQPHKTKELERKGGGR